MKLGKKNLVYSIGIASVLLIFLVIYFGIMLPSLNVSYLEQRYFDSIAKQHQEYMQSHTFAKEYKNYLSTCVTIEIPKAGNVVHVASSQIELEATIEDARILNLLDELRIEINDMDLEKEEENDFLSNRFYDTAKEIWKEYTQNHENRYIHINVIENGFKDLFQSDSQNAQYKVYNYSDEIAVVLLQVEDGENSYSNYLAFSDDSSSYYITYLPAMTPKMSELTPVILQSMPMLIAVTILIVLICSLFYSRTIVHPIEQLERYTRSAKQNCKVSSPPGGRNRKDEISSLGRALHELYTQLQSQNKELEEKNQILEEENLRQEVFLRSSSHQLKTPIAAALLLVDGMMNKVGKYKDTDAYLPEVKTQLLSMKKMVEEILYLSRLEQNIQMERTPLNLVIKECMDNYQVLALEKEQQIRYEGKDELVYTDINLLRKIISNLISNAIVYGETNSSIRIYAQKNTLSIFNRGEISKDLIPHLFEPFVTGNEDAHGHGLGLYIVSYYVKVLKGKITVENTILQGEKGVLATLTFMENEL